MKLGLILLMILMGSQVFSQTSVTKYRLNFSDIENNLNQVKAEFESSQEEGQDPFQISKKTILNFYILLELGERIEKLVLKDTTELSDQELEKLQLLIDDVKNKLTHTQQTIDNLEELLYLFENTDTVYLNDSMAIKFIDENASRKERRPYKKLRFKSLENLLRASGGVSSGGGG